MPDSRYLVRIEAAMKIDVDLYRGGNSMSPRLDHVRDKDVVKSQMLRQVLQKLKVCPAEFRLSPRPSPKRIGGG